MSNIIPLASNNTQITFQKAIVNDYEQEVYNARTLHTLLESKQQFADWIKNRLQDFVENVDFVSLSENYEKPLGGRPTKDFLLTINTAKHISMLERNEQGLKMRQAFIDAEKQLKKIQQQAPQLTGQEALYQLAEGLLKEKALRLEVEKDKLALENTVKEKEQVIQEKDERLETARQVFKKVADKSGCHSFRDCVTSLGIPQKQLRELLEKNKWICPKAKDSKGNKILKPTVSGSQYDYVKYPPKEGLKLANGKVAKEFLITEKGYNKLMQQLGKL